MLGSVGIGHIMDLVVVPGDIVVFVYNPEQAPEWQRGQS